MKPEDNGTASSAANRLNSRERLKQGLRRLPWVYEAARRFYRLFRGAETTLEQRIVREIGERAEVSFIQVGSNDGVQGDPIHDLIASRPGWHGVFIEPVGFLFRRLRANYAGSQQFVFENVAITPERTRRKFYYVSEQAKDHRELPYWYDQLGSFDREHIVRSLGAEIEPFIVEEDVECLPLQDVLDRNRIDALDLVHIDTEGSDYQVLAQFDLKRYRPAVILFEHHLLTDDDFAKACKFLRRNSYRLFRYGSDILAVRRRFRAPAFT